MSDKSDKIFFGSLVVRAAGRAEKAIEYILEKVDEKQDKQLQQASA